MISGPQGTSAPLGGGLSPAAAAGVVAAAAADEVTQLGGYVVSWENDDFFFSCVTGSLGFSVPAEGVANLGVPQMYLQLGGYVCWLIYGTFWG
mmetsp:Transcript_28363/g.46939  ORF Transcript_28363/g.46939 Transcript_28363/m.46939 type:complete len:93 (+) Transcript_28363:248-526(+)